jgi:predicted amidophosphoribosyltransferase
MTTLLEKAMAEASKLPEQEQEAFAAWILAELESERCWDDLFARSQGLLANMAEEAGREHDAGLTEPLDPDKL